MRESVVPLLACPRCHAEGRLSATVYRADLKEVREGVLTCESCAQTYAVQDGIVDLLYDPPDFVRREAAGLARFADRMRKDGWGPAKILALPDIDDGYWFQQGACMQQLLATLPFEPARRVLDVGANTCWASNIFAGRGLDVIALDIATTEMQGLASAEYFFAANPSIYFERILGTMFNIPLAAETVDDVFCCEVLHHNDPRSLGRTLDEIHRVLKPGGRLLVVNEPMRFLFDLQRDHGREVAEFEGYEHVYFFREYRRAIERAGFRVETILEPAYHPVYRGQPYVLTPDLPVRQAIKLVAAHAIRRSPWLRQLYHRYLLYLRGGVALSLVGRKR